MAGRAITLYLDEDTITEAKSEAAREGISLSEYARRRLASGRRTWPESLLDLLGSLKQVPLEAPTELSWEMDSGRGLL